LGNQFGINSTVPHNHEEGINSTSDTGTTMNNPNVNGMDISMDLRMTFVLRYGKRNGNDEIQQWRR
jgi:hypothetical protein